MAVESLPLRGGGYAPPLDMPQGAVSVTTLADRT